MFYPHLGAKKRVTVINIALVLVYLSRYAIFIIADDQFILFALNAVISFLFRIFAIIMIGFSHNVQCK